MKRLTAVLLCGALAGAASAASAFPSELACTSGAGSSGMSGTCSLE